MNLYNRRAFLQSSFGLLGFSTLFPICAKELNPSSQIMTVRGWIAADEMGLTLPHEHVLVDFIGADQIRPDRYGQDEAFKTAFPFLQEAKKLGIKTLVECTPEYIGRDPILLKRLSEATGMNILTNTGYYGAANDKFIPNHAYKQTAEQLAQRWINDWKNGINGTNIRPGFMKIGVDSGSLSEIDKKLVQAAALAHQQTGLTIASHTGDGVAALEQWQVLKKSKVDGSAFIWVHAQNESDYSIHERLGKDGVWLEFDGISPNSIEKHLQAVKAMKEKDLLHRVLFSHDAGWYHVGAPQGGNFRPYNTLSKHFIPELKKNGFSSSEINQMTIENPAQAFTIEVRMNNGRLK